MQKPIEGVYPLGFAETIEDRLRIGCSVNQKHAENAKRSHYSPAYLKGGYVEKSHNRCDTNKLRKAKVNG